MAARKAHQAHHADTTSTTVYRCGTTYQAAPCEHTAQPTPSQAIRAVDSRTADQIRAAYQAHQRLTKQAKAIEQAQSKQLRALQRQPLRAVGLSCHAPGTRPFETCQEKGEKGKASSKSALPRKQTDSPQRQGPYVAHVSGKAPG
jgi:alpha-D-ribose 1-methylphosphonate 5-triphosphate diphosphatase PhnM